MIMRKIYRPGLLFRRPCNFSTIVGSKSSIDHLCTHLNISESQAEYLCCKHPILRKLTELKMKSVLDTLSDLGYPKEVVVDEPRLLSMLPVTLKYRYEVVHECGIEPVSPTHLASYFSIIKRKTVGELKASGYIPDSVNVENQLASCMTQWPTSIASLTYNDVNNCTLHEIRLKIIQRYLELLLDLSKQEFNKALKTYPTIKHRPLKVINETLNILQAVIVMPVQKIKSHLYLVHADPDNLKSIIYNFRSIGGIDIKEVIRLYPKLAIKSYSTLVEIRKVLHDYNISDEAQRKCFDIYTLGPSTVRERLENAKTIPEINFYFGHPRFLKIIHHNSTVMKRLEMSANNNKKCMSLNVLASSSSYYEIFENTPGDRLGKGRDLIFCISQSLGNVYSKNSIQNLIKRHPFWINIPVVQVIFVYQQLAEEFTAHDIYENCPILLYPWVKVKDILKMMTKMQTGFAFDFLENEHLDLSKLSNSQKLSLALYLLEKSYYFTGNGVWTEKKIRTVEIT